MLKMAVAASCAPRMEMRLLSGPSNKISLVVLLDVTCGLALLWAVVINTFYFMSLRTFAYAVPWCCPVFSPSLRPSALYLILGLSLNTLSLKMEVTFIFTSTDYVIHDITT